MNPLPKLRRGGVTFFFFLVGKWCSVRRKNDQNLASLERKSQACRWSFVTFLGTTMWNEPTLSSVRFGERTSVSGSSGA